MSEVLGTDPVRVEASLLFDDCLEQFKQSQFAVAGDESAANVGVFQGTERLEVGLFSFMKFDESGAVKPCYVIAMDNENRGIKVTVRVFESGEAAAQVPSDIWREVDVNFLQTLRVIVKNTDWSREKADLLVQK